jgi:hypothetical protein
MKLREAKENLPHCVARISGKVKKFSPTFSQVAYGRARKYINANAKTNFPGKDMFVKPCSSAKAVCIHGKHILEAVVIWDQSYFQYPCNLNTSPALA